MIIDEDDYLEHYGILRKSGRYPWGSGGNADTAADRSQSFFDYIDEMKAKGLSEVEIAAGVGMSTTELRATRTIAKDELKRSQIVQAQKLKDKGYSTTAIGRTMNIPESTVRTLLAPGAEVRANNLNSIVNMLRDEVANKQIIDVGAQVERHIGISKERLGAAVALLEDEGYQVKYLKVPQLGTRNGNNTSLKVLVAPGVTNQEAYRLRDNVQQIGSFSNDRGDSFDSIQAPLSISQKRVAVRYAEDGGTNADGVIYVRRGVPDVSLGQKNYAQVRVLVNDTHYLKGMAMYKDDLPPGVDLMFNTNKSDTGNKLDAMKPIKDDPTNPFGSAIRQIKDLDADGNPRVSSVMNLVSEEGDWNKWSKTLSSQMLSKQSPKLAKEQLDMTYERRLMEFEKIKALTNPTVKKALLNEFASGTDSASVHLKAASLPRQRSQVILPIESMKPGEIYAPNFKPGERVVLIRHPHGGTFEIPELTVNNRHPEAKKLLGNAEDAVGIHPSVAERLSGADFDGDTVLVIPNNSGKVKTTSALEELKNFNPRIQYKGYEGMKPMTNTQTEMGKISNLITDMTIRGAPPSDIARAVKHSMVVIDAEKHGLDYKQSYIDNGIKSLKDRYQKSDDGSTGASTIISRAKSRIDVPDRKLRIASEGGHIDPITGKLVYTPTGEINYKTGAPKTNRSKKLAETDDAHTLSSGTPIERVYAEHSNKLKDLANQARLEYLKTPRANYSPSARKVYENQVASLDAKLSIALKNAPLERQAQIIANAAARVRKEAEPNLTADQKKKIDFLELEKARARLGARKIKVDVSPLEWEAIQSGAISDGKLKDILLNADMDQIRDYATPPVARTMTSTKKRRAESMLASGYPRSEIADALGVSISTLDEAMKEE